MIEVLVARASHVCRLCCTLPSGQKSATASDYTGLMVGTASSACAQNGVDQRIGFRDWHAPILNIVNQSEGLLRCYGVFVDKLSERCDELSSLLSTNLIKILFALYLTKAFLINRFKFFLPAFRDATAMDKPRYTVRQCTSTNRRANNPTNRSRSHN